MTAKPLNPKRPAPLLHRAALLERFGPGLITGAADDDPSGIATYSQAGAQYGFGMLWTLFLTYPLMAAVQSVAARIGRVTGQGLAANMGDIMPRGVVLFLVGLLFLANTINIGADLAAMGEATALITGVDSHYYAAAFALFIVAAQIFMSYRHYVRVLKWLTLVLFAYVAVVLVVKVDWASAAFHVVQPGIKLDAKALTVIVAVFGTTISPYLFFWQSSQEVEEVDAGAAEPLIDDPAQARPELKRIKWDTLIGMGFSNLIALAVMLATAATLHANGQTNIETAAQAAEALRPVAGDLAFALFAAGIIGTGLLAVPVLAGSSAYAVAECQGWRCGLENKLHQAWGFYAVIAAAVVLGVAVGFSPIDPIQALFWSAVVNGVISVPILTAMMLVASKRSEMGVFTATRTQLVLGWLTTAVMAAAVAGMAFTMFQ
ncbi:MAG: NRAMP family divalent metal transporter [Caulobacteraceae bacterium]